MERGQELRAPGHGTALPVAGLSTNEAQLRP